MTPGAYLAARRQAYRLSPEQLAERIECSPHLSLIDRTAWLKAIEADVMPARETTIVAISENVPLDLDLLEALDAARTDGAADVPPYCHRCGVTPRQTQEASAWPSETLCPTCAA